MQWPLAGRDEELRELSSAVAGGACAVVLAGEAGVGKTRLASELLGQLAKAGVTVHRAAATEASSAVPFGVFAPLLARDAVEGSDRLQLLLQVRAALLGNPDERPVVAVDDAHLLDDGAAALVHQLVMSREAFVVLTVRAGEPVPDAVTGVWKDAGARRVEVRPLSREAVAGVVEQRLGGPASAELQRQLWHLSQGYPLFLSELLAGGLDSGAMARQDGLWRLSGPLLPSARLTEIVTQRLARLPPDAGRAVEYLAVSKALEVPVLERLAGRAALEALEAAALLAWEDDGARRLVRLTHPLHGEVVGTVLSRTRAERVNRELAAALEPLGMKRGTDVLRVASFRLGAGLVRDHRLFTAAAQAAVARFDHRLAERLARAALRASEEPEARLALGESLRCQNRFGEADEQLRRVEAAAGSDSLVARCALARAQTLCYGLRRPRAGLDVAKNARDRISDPGWRAELDALIALIATFLGDLEGAAEAGGRVIAQPGVAPRTVVNTLVVSTVAQVLLGRFEEASEHIAHGLRLAAAVDDALPMAEDLLLVNDAFLDLFAGRLEEAERKHRSRFGHALEEGIDDLVGLWGSMTAHVLSFRGNVGEAVEVCGQALAALERSDPLGLHPTASAFHAMDLALTGDPGAARALLDSLVTAGGRLETRARLHRDRALVWVSVAEGHLERAATMARDAGEQALEDDLVAWGMIVLHDAVRLGFPGLVRARLEAAAAAVEGELLPELVTHARALAASDAGALDRVSERFETLGSDLYAAEAAAQAAVVHGRAGATRRASRSSARALRLRARCLPARTPAVAGWSSQLTSREQEVALLAADGLTSPAIAQRLVISPRTVDNHLASVYRKLGLHGRHELSDALLVRERPGT